MKSSKNNNSSSADDKRKRSPHGDKLGDSLTPTGFILECDPPVKQFVQYNDSTRHEDKKWILADLDERHLLIKTKYRNEIIKKVEEWMDSNVFSSVERVGEDLDMS